MNHEPFEHWLFARETLSPDQQAALEAHLRRCEACAALDAAWRQAETLLQGAPAPAPRPGFAARWRMRERAWRQRRQRRFNALAAGVVLVGALGSALGLGVLWWQAPARPLTALASALAQAFSFGRAITVMLHALLDAAPLALGAAVALVALGVLALFVGLGWGARRRAFAGFPLEKTHHGGAR